ncbi:MAG: M20/M25/M40 family metallo-hydrolase [Deltaproteobacteria bacterium]|nr:M20/M25/M40 family metallo-hydrolase [Deltaproteobacteria bacterium]
MSLGQEVFEKEALGHFRALLRVNTTNPPGNEMEAVHYLASLLDREGIPYEILEPQPNRGSIVARLQGDGSLPPLLLTSHLDVVPVERSEWRYDPFGGEIQEGCVWGRGAVDMKSMTVFELMAFLQLKRSGAKLKRDVILAAVADEEAGMDWGMKWICENRPELVRAEYALNEVGGFSITMGKRRIYTLQVAEKGVAWLKMRAKGKPGHGSMPHEENAVARLARAIDKIDRNPLPLHVTAPVRSFIKDMSRFLPFPLSILIHGLLKPATSEVIRRWLPAERKKFFLAALHNTATPTMLEAGSKINVIPSKAEAYLDGRTLPGTTHSQFLQELKKIVGDGIEFEVIRQGPPLTFSSSGPFVDLVTRMIQKYDPQGTLVPYLTVGYTDAKPLSEIGVTTYGFMPMKLPPDLVFSDLYHGHNERIPVDSFLWGVHLFYDLVREWVA